MSHGSVNGKIREAIVEGIFYPDDPAVLASAVDRALGGASAVRRGALAILSPHAGIAYSGPVQAAAWAAAAGAPFKRLVILAPRHRAGESAVYLPESSLFRTPLGDIPVDAEFCAELESCGTVFETNDIPHLEEHAIEVQLPFAQRLFPEARLAPMIVAGRDPAVIASLARALDLLLSQDGRDTLVVASSNLASSMNAAEAAGRSDEIVAAFLRGDWRPLARAPEGDERPAGGTGAVAAVLAMNLLAGARRELILRVDSQRIRESNAERVVNYAAAAWYPASGGEGPA